ncbi:MAG: hypothetical protein Q9216_000682 [Gyalolechia sp. 2 TL-2023]
MSASTLITTVTANQSDIFRHYGKLAGAGHNQDMEIEPDLPRPIEANSHSDTMDTSLDSNQPNDQTQTSTVEHTHALPTKALVVQQPFLAAEPAVVTDVADEAPGQMAHKPAGVPQLQHDLLTLYGLKPLADTVARLDPDTGKKINKVRKSYEGKIKSFGLAGRNRAVKTNELSKGLLHMAQWPAEEWHNQKVHGKDVRGGFSQAAMQKLKDAMSMRKAPVPDTAEYHWDDVLGIEKAKPLPDERLAKPSRQDSSVKVNGQNNGVRIQPETASIIKANRPKRTGKKRRYDDHSFEGYGEGYLDDDGDILGDLGGYSSDDGSRRGGVSKKRRKEYTSASPPTMGDRRGSYGIGMLGVGSGIGAYGR